MLEAFVVARSAIMGTMDSAAVLSSALGLVFTATLFVAAPMVRLAASSPLLSATSARRRLQFAAGLQFVVALMSSDQATHHQGDANSWERRFPIRSVVLNTQAPPALTAERQEDEEVVPDLSIRDPFNTAARTGVSPFLFLDKVGSSAPPPAALPLPPWMTGAGTSASPLAATPANLPRTRAEAAARMKAQALPATSPTASPSPAEGNTSAAPSLRRFLGRTKTAVDRRPGIRRGTWNPAALGLPSAEVLNAVAGEGFYSPGEGESSSD